MQEVNRILKQYRNDPSDIIAILQDVQRTYRYLPEEVLRQVADRLDIPLSRVYHLATFFRAFSLEKRGRHVLHVCMGTACHVRGSPRILEALERDLEVKAGKTTPDLACTLETVNCVGACALGPVIVADDKSLGKMTPQKAERMLKQMGLGARAQQKPAAADVPEAPEPRAKAVSRRAVRGSPKKAAPAAKATRKQKAAASAAKSSAATKAAGRKAKKPVGPRVNPRPRPMARKPGKPVAKTSPRPAAKKAVRGKTKKRR